MPYYTTSVTVDGTAVGGPSTPVSCAGQLYRAVWVAITNLTIGSTVTVSTAGMLFDQISRPS